MTTLQAITALAIVGAVFSIVGACLTIAGMWQMSAVTWATSSGAWALRSMFVQNEIDRIGALLEGGD